MWINPTFFIAITTKRMAFLNEFNCNRPFLFAIKKTTGEVLFIGRYGTKITATAVTEKPKVPRGLICNPYFQKYYPQLCLSPQLSHRTGRRYY